MILSEKHQMMRKLYRQFAETEFTPELLDHLEETGEFNWDMHNKMAKYGFMGVKIPVEYGGQGGDSLAYVMMVEEFARVSPVLSIYAKAMEMKNTIQTFQNQKADMSMCSLPQSKTDSDPLHMIQEIRDYCGPATRQKIDQCINLIAMMEIADLFQNDDSESNP